MHLRRGRHRKLVWLGLAWSLGWLNWSAALAGLVRGPYLQSGTATNIVVRWRTSSAESSRVWFGTNLAQLNQSTGNLAVVGDHEINLTGLSPDQKYFYAIGNDTTLLAGSNANFFFVTAPVPGPPKPTRVWVIGDSGTQTPEQIQVRDAFQQFTAARPADFWLMLGDNAYYYGTDGEYQGAVFNIYTNQLRSMVLWPTLGNHDAAEQTNYADSYPYFEMFTLPKNGEAGGLPSGTEHFYSFNYANLHFICLDSSTASRSPTGVMYAWLTNDLAQNTADWTIAYWHHSPYTKASHDSDVEIELIEMRQIFLPALEQGGVDLVLSGHSHSYERSGFMDGHYGPSATFTNSMQRDPGMGRPSETGAYRKSARGNKAHQGTVYAVVGSSGWIYGGPLNHPAMVVSSNALGSLVLDVSGLRLDATFLRETGATNDSFTIIKTNFPPRAHGGSLTSLAGVTVVLGLTGDAPNGTPLTFATDQLPAHGVLWGLNPNSGAVAYTPARGFAGLDQFTFHVADEFGSSVATNFVLNILPPPDTNHNGLPDDWEAANGAGNPADDPDSDGQSNWQEYRANTDPNDPTSVLRIHRVAVGANQQCTIFWRSVPGTRYRVSYRDGDLSGPFTELALPAALEMDRAPLVPAPERSFTDDFSLTLPLTNSARFYRLRVVE